MSGDSLLLQDEERKRREENSNRSVALLLICLVTYVYSEFSVINRYTISHLLH